MIVSTSGLAVTIHTHKYNNTEREIMKKPIDVLNFILAQSKHHNPTLKTFVRIEKLVLKKKKFNKKQDLYNLLPRGMRYPTFNFILTILEMQGKIIFNKDGSFFWVGNASKRSRKITKKTKRR